MGDGQVCGEIVGVAEDSSSGMSGRRLMGSDPVFGRERKFREEGFVGVVERRTRSFFVAENSGSAAAVSSAAGIRTAALGKKVRRNKRIVVFLRIRRPEVKVEEEIGVRRQVSFFGRIGFVGTARFRTFGVDRRHEVGPQEVFVDKPIRRKRCSEAGEDRGHSGDKAVAGSKLALENPSESATFAVSSGFANATVTVGVDVFDVVVNVQKRRGAGRSHRTRALEPPLKAAEVHPCRLVR